MKKTVIALALGLTLAACGSPEPIPEPDYGEYVVEPTTTRATSASIDPSQSCEEIGREYEAKPGDPHDGDGDGIACEGG